MKKLVNREMMQEIDRITKEEFGMPSMVLMERAALKVYEHILELMVEKLGTVKPLEGMEGKAIDSSKKREREESVLVVCGCGNNGGDGVAIARLLHLAGINASLTYLGSFKKATSEMQEQLVIAQNLGVPIITEPTYNEYSIIVDAIFGVGLTRPITGEYEAAIAKINSSKAMVVAVDLPSGINADDGMVMNIAVKADVTVTFGYQKIGLIRYPGCEYAGNVFVEDVGFPDSAYDEMMMNHPNWSQSFTFTKEDLNRLPMRPQHSNKGTFGTVLVVAGSKGMSGACYFSAKAALRMGAGLVKIMTVSDNRQIIQTALPEAVVITYDEEDMKQEHRIDSYRNVIQSADVIIVGPGLGKSQLSEEVLKMVLKHTKVPAIVDADGINLLADWVAKAVKGDDEEEELSEDLLKKRITYLQEILPENVILTPHLKEFSRLIQRDIRKIYKKFIDTVDICSYNKVLIYIIKDSITTVAKGKKRYYNTSGNDGLATGGSGDVLTGMIGGLIAQGLDAYEAACLGVFVHGLTSESYSKQHYSGSMLASDIIEQIGDVLR